jgi:hypothetical protein
MTLQKQLEYIHREFLVDTQWVEDQLNDRKASIAEVDNDLKTNCELSSLRNRESVVLIRSANSGTRLLNSSIKLTTENIILSTTDMRIRKQTLHQL